jgi:DNA-binding transcriptional LysR family regulator
VSERVAALEADLGVRLLERTTRSVRPTEAGARYFEQCAAMVAHADEANATVRNAQLEPAGRLRVASSVSFGQAHVVDVVAEYLRSWPKMRVELLLVDRQVQLVEEGFDVVFWVEPPDDHSLVAKPLGQALAYFVASPAYVAMHGEPKSLAAVRSVGWAAETWSLPSGKPVRIDPHFVVNDAHAALRAALLGVGVARLPSVLIEPHVHSGALRLMFGGVPARSTMMSVIYSGRFVPAKVRRFLDIVVQRIAPMRSLAPTVRRGRTDRP